MVRVWRLALVVLAMVLTASSSWALKEGDTGRDTDYYGEWVTRPFGEVKAYKTDPSGNVHTTYDKIGGWVVGSPGGCPSNGTPANGSLSITLTRKNDTDGQQVAESPRVALTKTAIWSCGLRGPDQELIEGGWLMGIQIEPNSELDQVNAPSGLYLLEVSWTGYIPQGSPARWWKAIYYQAPAGSLSVTVRNAQNGGVMIGARVQLLVSGSVVYSSTSDGQGTARFREVAAGSYAIVASCTGYLSVTGTYVQSPQTAFSLTIQLQPEGTSSGSDPNITTDCGNRTTSYGPGASIVVAHTLTGEEVPLQIAGSVTANNTATGSVSISVKIVWSIYKVTNLSDGVGVHLHRGDVNGPVVWTANHAASFYQQSTTGNNQTDTSTTIVDTPGSEKQVYTLSFYRQNGASTSSYEGYYYATEISLKTTANLCSVLDAGSGSSSTGGSGSGSSDGTNILDSDWWSDLASKLFMPSDQTMTAYRDLVDQMAAWGPWGWIRSTITAWNAAPGTEEGAGYGPGNEGGSGSGYGTLYGLANPSSGQVAGQQVTAPNILGAPLTLNFFTSGFQYLTGANAGGSWVGDWLRIIRRFEGYYVWAYWLVAMLKWVRPKMHIG